MSTSSAARYWRSSIRLAVDRVRCAKPITSSTLISTPGSPQLASSGAAQPRPPCPSMPGQGLNNAAVRVSARAISAWAWVKESSRSSCRRAGIPSFLGKGATQPTGLWAADSRGGSGWSASVSFKLTISRFTTSLSVLLSGCLQHKLGGSLLRRRSITCCWLELWSTTVKQQREDLQSATAGFARGKLDNLDIRK